MHTRRSRRLGMHDGLQHAMRTDRRDSGGRLIYHATPGYLTPPPFRRARATGRGGLS